MDREMLLELVPHYLAMMFLVFVVLGGLRSTVGELDLWLEFLVVVAVVVAYRPVVLRLGWAPSAWER